MSVSEKFDRLAAGFSQHDYADPVRYAAHCAAVICECSPGLGSGSTVLDLACGDGLVTAELLARGVDYTGVDLSGGMVEAARARYPGVRFEQARIEDYTPPRPVDTTVCLRAYYYPPDRVAFFRHVASYTRTFVFDFRVPDAAPGAIAAQLRSAGFATVRLRPFFLPQLRALPGPLVPFVYGLERSGPLARLLLRRAGRVFCAASV